MVKKGIVPPPLQAPQLITTSELQGPSGRYRLASLLSLDSAAVKRQSTYDMEEDAPVQQPAVVQEDAPAQQAAAMQAGANIGTNKSNSEQAPTVGHESLKLKPRKRGQGTATQKRRKQLRLDKALGVADKKSTKAIKLSTAKQRKQHAKALWSKAE